MAAHSKKLVVAVIVFVAAQAIAAPPTRIISLVPALTEMLFAIGAGPLVVGVGSYDEFPPEVKSLARVGALLDPDMERMLSLRPDLVLIYGSQSDLQTQLTRAGVRTYNYRHAGLEGVFRTIDELGTLLERKADADRVARDLRAQIDAVAERVKGRRRPRTLLVFERDPASLRGLFVSGGRGFLHDVLEASGGTNVFADVDRESVQPSLETLLARAPEVIVEVQASGVFGPEKPAAGQPDVWSALASVPAVKERRIHRLVGQYLVVPGPRLGRATEAVARVLHPEAFK